MNPTTMTKTLLALSALVLCAPAFAGKVLLETPVTYAANASVVQKVKDECHLEDSLVKYIGEALAKENGSEGTAASGAAPADAGVLRVRITHVLGVGGGAWTGPKAITVSAELLENNKVKRQTSVNRWTTGGMWSGFKGTCTILERSAAAIGKDLGRWSFDPSAPVGNDAPR